MDLQQLKQNYIQNFLNFEKSKTELQNYVFDKIDILICEDKFSEARILLNTEFSSIIFYDIYKKYLQIIEAHEKLQDGLEFRPIH